MTTRHRGENVRKRNPGAIRRFAIDIVESLREAQRMQAQFHRDYPNHRF